MNNDGTVVSRQILEVLPDMLLMHKNLNTMQPDAGSTSEKVIHVVVLFDAFPVENISATHCCVANTSL
eukprot:6182893-Pleurochrysis_carterae.AAC.2